jgi:mono/diheme cytochrome c family protein
MKFSVPGCTKTTNALLTAALALGALLWAGAASNRTAFAQNTNAQAATQAPAPASAGKDVVIDEHQRSAQVFYMQRFAKSGWQRGEEIYYMKCWICHNDYTIKAEKGAAPTLRGMYKKESLWNGDPVNDQTVIKQIKDGSSRMPGFGYTLNDKDMADLMAYLRDKCCWDETKPEPNPKYKYQ